VHNAFSKAPKNLEMVEYKNIIYMDFATCKMSKVSRFVGCFITGGSGKFIDLKIE